RRSSVLGASLAPHLAATFTQWNSGSIGLHLVLQTYPSQLCLIWFVYLGSRVCRQLPSDSTSRWTPLSLANGSYYQVRRRLSLPRHNTCPAHNKRKPEARPVSPLKHYAFNNLAFIATIIVLKLINTAPTAGLRIMPMGASTPAASGMATIL